MKDWRAGAAPTVVDVDADAKMLVGSDFTDLIDAICGFSSMRSRSNGSATLSLSSVAGRAFTGVERRLGAPPSQRSRDIGRERDEGVVQ